ncbi:hypothetical protein Tco_0195927 [Tanacetum coccineum]
MRSLGAVGSTIHSMIKFPTNQGIVTIETSREALWECRHLERVQGSWKEVQWRQREEQMSRIKEQVILRTKNSSRRGLNFSPVSLEKMWDKEDTEEVCIISHERSDRSATMGTTLTASCKQLPTNLKIYPLTEPMAHKRWPMASEGRLALKEKVFRWVKEGLIRKVQRPEWTANTIHVKLANGTWKVQVDYSSLNKVCVKNMYPFLKEGEGLASIMGYLYKCFLRLLKEYNQIRMTEDDEEKTGFHTEEGVYCFTHMPKELQNSATTLQRMMEKVLADHRG